MLFKLKELIIMKRIAPSLLLLIFVIGCSGFNADDWRSVKCWELSTGYSKNASITIYGFCKGMKVDKNSDKKKIVFSAEANSKPIPVKVSYNFNDATKIGPHLTITPILTKQQKNISNLTILGKIHCEDKVIQITAKLRKTGDAKSDQWKVVEFETPEEIAKGLKVIKK